MSKLTDQVDAIFDNTGPYEHPALLPRRLVDRLVIEIDLLRERVNALEAQQLPPRPPYDPVSDTTLE